MTKTPTRPTVAMNMAITADGKISTHRRETISLGSPNDRYLMDKLRARADAVVIGANVVLSTRLNLPRKGEFFSHPDTERLIITTLSAPSSKIARFERVAHVHVLPRRRIRPKDVIDHMAARRARRVLIEGGGETNFSFISSGLVDEIYITVTPWILGGRTAPTAVDGAGFLRNKRVRLELVSSRREDNEVFLRYRVIKR
jgi:2,5-diamino-6-(ribosylamino)-4(3H)-pyrimidinone 5'-phosphate reductase